MKTRVGKEASTRKKGLGREQGWEAQRREGEKVANGSGLSTTEGISGKWDFQFESQDRARQTRTVGHAERVWVYGLGRWGMAPGISPPHETLHLQIHGPEAH